jgi:alkyl hydroperoxide reductase subunit F
MHDLIIIGGGPAGLTSAIYAVRKRLDVVLVSDDLGGKTIFHMNLPWTETHRVIRGAEIVDGFRRELEYLDFAHRMETVSNVVKHDDVFTVTTNTGDTLEALSVVYATGSDVKLLGVPGECDYLGKGVSYSAISYAPLFLGRKTVVVGDGTLAMRAAAELAQVAESVHLVVPDHAKLETPRAKAVAADPKVTVLRGYTIKAIDGEEYVERVVVQGPDGAEETIPASGVFVEIKLVPNTDPIRALAKLDESGRVIIDQANHTSCPGLFAAGDVTNVPAEQVLIAVGEGAKAALSAHEYVTLRKALAMAH